MALSEIEIMKLIHTLDVHPHAEPLDAADAKPERTAERVAVDGPRIVVSPEAEGVTLLEAHAPIALRVNGLPVEGRAAVTAEDEIEWDAKPPAMFDIDIAKDRMSVYLRVHHTVQRFWKPAIERVEPNLVRLMPELAPDAAGEPLTSADVRTALHDLHLVRYDMKRIEEELRAPTHEPILIAEGIRPVPSVDASVELLFEESVQSSYEEVNGHIDFRNHLKIPCAKAGEIVARKKPCVEGSPGFDVFGNKIEPSRPKDVAIVPKQHVRMTAEGDIVAMKEGRPRMTGGRIKFISINPSYVVPNDVDLKTGNIFFSGDVIVYGDVTDGMVIEALGNVYVAGGVFNATVTATGSIRVRGNIIGGKLYSGHFGVLYNRLYNHAKKLNETLQLLRNAASMLFSRLEAQGKTVPEGQAYQLLADSKFKDIPATVKEIMSSIATIQTLQRNHLEETKQKLTALLLPSCFLKIEPVAYLNELQRMLIDIADSIQRCEETDVALDISKCQLSTLMSNGDILVRQEGVIQSNLYGRKHIVFYQANAVCKGSTLEAGHTLSASIVGGAHGGACVLKAGTKILVSKMYDGRVFIGRYSQEILEPLEHAVITVRDNRLTVEGQG